VDTGAIYSAITEKEATMMKIDVSLLPYSKRRAVGFGGFFRNKIINREVILTFKSNKDEYKVKCGGFEVICTPPNVTSEERDKLIQVTPNVLGMDILRRFKTYVDKNGVELVL
jgi:hypothetical protein